LENLKNPLTIGPALRGVSGKQI